MKFTIPTILALAGLASAQDIQSKPFKLSLTSADKNFNGKGVSACHTGAAIEALCIGAGVPMNFNTTKGSQVAAKGYTPSGILTYSLPSRKPPPPLHRFFLHLQRTLGIVV